MVSAYYIPNGPKNLKHVFPTIDFNDLSEYFIVVKDEDNSVIATTSKCLMEGCSDENVSRIHFLNMLGAIDAINFKIITKENDPSSDKFEKPTSYPLNKENHSSNRYNVKANKTFKAVTTEYIEENQDWISELFNSPLAWLQWTGTQDQPDSYIPILITDVKTEELKEDERFVYQVTIEFSLSNSIFTIRN